MYKIQKSSYKNKIRSQNAFTIVEVLVVVTIISIMAGMVTLGFSMLQKETRDTYRGSKMQVLSEALERYYKKNSEYPSVAFMTSQDSAAIVKKLELKDAGVLKLPLAASSAATSISVSNPSPTTVVYSANTSDASKNSQCQTVASGYCDGYQLAYAKEANGQVAVVKSRFDTFTPITGGPSCASGETQSGNTCTRTYAATYQSGYSCPSGGTLSGTNCTDTQAASSSGAGYYCPNGGSLSGSTCTYGATSTTTCPSGYTYSGGTCSQTSTYTDTQTCPPGTTKVSTTWDEKTATYNTTCKQFASPTTTYSCPSGGSVSGSNCTYTASYSSGSYTCPSGYTLSGSNCTKTYAATQSGGYYYCSDGGTVNGSTCTYTYTLP